MYSILFIKESDESALCSTVFIFRNQWSGAFERVRFFTEFSTEKELGKGRGVVGSNSYVET